MKYILALDVGTTTVRCHVIDEDANTITECAEKVELLYPRPGYVEIDPDHLWNIVLKVVKAALNGNGIDPNAISCFGISTQRGSFVNWDPNTGKHYHRFITWKDLRADSIVKEWNRSITLKGVRLVSYILYVLSRSKRMLTASDWKFMNVQMTMRLVWALQYIPGLREAAANGNAIFGGVDCWLLYKLTGKHVTDVSSASATGLFDPFTMQWATWLMHVLKIPPNIFPEVVDTTRNFGVTPKNIFGAEIPILCSMADHSASLFGSGCFQQGDMKITMGTGSFLNVNTASVPHASVVGLYPVVGWRIGSELVYAIEGSSNDTGTIVEWAKAMEFVKNEAETSDLAKSVNDSDGVYFVNAFSGLQAPLDNQTAAAGFLGVKPTTRKAHLVRSLLESLVFRLFLLYQCLCEETNFKYKRIRRIDGGVSRNDFIVQLIADVTGLEVERATTVEMSILGVAFLAGLECGIWKNKEDLKHCRRVERIFRPNEKSQLHYKEIITQWKQAVDRFRDWY